MEVSFICAACGNQRPSSAMHPGSFVPDNVVEQIQKKHPRWTTDQLVCDNCVSEGKADLAEEMLQEEMSDLSPLDEEVVESIRTDSIIIMRQRDQQRRDRLRADNEYRVNLKAELEMRYLDDKVKKMMSIQRQVLSELREKQNED